MLPRARAALCGGRQRRSYMVLRTVLNPRSVSAFFSIVCVFLELLFVELYFLWFGHRGGLIHFGLV